MEFPAQRMPRIEGKKTPRMTGRDVRLREQRCRPGSVHMGHMGHSIMFGVY